MSNGQIMLPYTIKAGINSNDYPVVVAGTQSLGPSTAADDSYWWYFLDNSTQKLVYQLLVPGSSNTSVPAGIDAYMSNPDLLFGIVTQSLSSLHLPQGALFNYLVNYGAGDGLLMLEQANAALGCGYLGQIAYILIGQGGPRGGTFTPPSYDEGSIFTASVLEVSLASQMNGQPPYSIVDTYTFTP